jgi:hypothetical protein
MSEIIDRLTPLFAASASSEHSGRAKLTHAIGNALIEV